MNEGENSKRILQILRTKWGHASCTSTLNSGVTGGVGEGRGQSAPRDF